MTDSQRVVDLGEFDRRATELVEQVESTRAPMLVTGPSGPLVAILPIDIGYALAIPGYRRRRQAADQPQLPDAPA